MTGGLFRGSAEWMVTGRSFPPARFALALPEAEGIELGLASRSLMSEVKPPKL